ASCAWPWKFRKGISFMPRPRSMVAGELPLALFPGAQFGGESLTEVLHLEHRAQLQLGTGLEGGALDPLGGLVERAHLPQPVAGEQFAGLGEGAVGDAMAAAVVEAHPARP